MCIRDRYDKVHKVYDKVYKVYDKVYKVYDKVYNVYDKVYNKNVITKQNIEECASTKVSYYISLYYSKKYDY